jgi:signal transduction histidine kinase
MVVVAIFALAYGFYHAFRGEATLVSTGLVSFVAMAQFAPPMIGALFWRDGRPGPALAGIVSGGVLWFILLMLPFYLSAAGDAQIFAEGYFGIGWLHPYRLFDVGGMPPILHATFWSLFVNIVVFIGGSLLKRPSAEVERQAELFINVFAYGDRLEETYRWRGEAQVSTLKALLRRYLGKAETERLIGAFMARHDISVSDSDKADPRLVTFVETELSSILGPAAARLLVASVVKEQRSTRRDVLRMIQQTQQYLSDNQALQRQSRELEAAAREIQRSHEKLEKLSSVKDDFISTVTHELRTPLTSIKAYVEFLSEEDLSEDQRAQFLATLTRETDRMARLINQVLELERLADDEGAVDMRSCQMLQILERAATAMRPMFEEREAMLIIDAPDELPPLNGDADALHQVLLNLLSNALKHLPAEGGKVVLSAFYLDGGITLSVRDNGPGIPAEFRETIFDRFVQVREAPQRKPAGSGLGLAISRRIVQRHRGQIWLENPPGGGAKFVLFVPLNRPVDPDSKPAAFQ